MKKLFFIASLILLVQPNLALAVTQLTVTPDAPASANDRVSQGFSTLGTANTPNTVAAPSNTTAQSNGNLGYTPLEPIPGVTSPTGNGSYDPAQPGQLPAMINAIFRVLITVGALLAVLSLTVGGVQYMTASSVGNKTRGLDRARAALWGIALIAGVWLILNTVNPQLLNFNFSPCKSGGTACSSLANVPTPASNTTPGTSNPSGTIQTPYGTFTTQSNTDLTNATGCANSGGTWKYFTNASGGLSTGGTCYVGATQTGVGAAPY